MPSPRSRRRSSTAMSDRVEYMEESIGVFGDIIEKLRSDSMVVKYEALQVVGQNCSFQADVHGAILAELLANDESRLVRHSAARALGTLGHGASPHASVLANALQDSESLVRRDAAKALAGVSPEALQPHTKALATSLEDDFWPVRLWACKGLIACGPAAAAKVAFLPRKLAHMAVSDPEDGVQDLAAKVLAILGKRAVEHIKWIVEKLLSPKEEDHVSACRALASILSTPGGQAYQTVTSALTAVIQTTEDGSEGGSLSSRQAISTLEGALQDEDWQTRLRAVEALRNLALR